MLTPKPYEQGKFRRRADGGPDMVAILRSLLEIASGMAYLHSLGVLHGSPQCCNGLVAQPGVLHGTCAVSMGVAVDTDQDDRFHPLQEQ